MTWKRVLGVAVLPTILALLVDMINPNIAGAQNPPPPIIMSQPTLDPSWKPGDPVEAPMPQFAPPGESFATPVDNSSIQSEPTLRQKVVAVVLVIGAALVIALLYTIGVFIFVDPLYWRMRR